MSRKGEPGRKWTEEQKQAHAARIKALWANPEYRKTQTEKLLLQQKKESEQKKLRARSKPIHMCGSRLMRQRLIEMYGNKCRLCEQGPAWNGRELIFQSHHINGEELVLLCPNCHTQEHRHRVKAVEKRTPSKRRFRNKA